MNPQAESAELSIHLGAAVLSPDGKNTIEIVAYDAAGMLSTPGVRVPWTTPAVPEKPQRLFAIVAGVSRYDNDALNLRYAAKDAPDFAHALQTGAERLFGPDHVSIHILSTAPGADLSSPSKDEFRKAVDAIARQAGSEDVFVLYLAGHGASRSGAADQYYFLTSAARNTELPANDPAMLERTVVSSDELKQWCERIPALKQVIILDTCAAGAANRELIKLADRRELQPDHIRALELLKDATGSHVLMGSAADAVSYEAGRYGQGLLTYALLEGMKGGALDDGQRVDVRRLFDFAARQVEVLAAGIGRIQPPVVSSPQGQTFPIGLFTEEDRRSIVLAAPKPQLLRVSCLDADDADPSGLTNRVRTLLRDLSEPVTRQRSGSEPPVIYLDSVVDDLPSALIPRVRYNLRDGKIQARMRLFRDNRAIADEQIAPEPDPAHAARSIASAILAAVARLQTQ